MVALVWDASTNRHYETGVQQVALYQMDASGNYPLGVAWNGITNITESPSGAEASPLYADNIKYLELVSLEEFGGTIEAFTYPDEFAECDGSKEHSVAVGLTFGQQTRKKFGLVYKTLIGNDVDGDAHGYKLHLVYGCLATPSEKAYPTINDSPEAVQFSWEFTTTPDAAVVSTFKPTSLLIVDSTQANAGKLATLLETLYGATAVVPSLPHPDAIVTALTP